MEIDPNTEWMSPSELQEWLGLGRSKTYEVLNEEIPSYRIGRKIKVRHQDVEQWLESHKSHPTE